MTLLQRKAKILIFSLLFLTECAELSEPTHITV